MDRLKLWICQTWNILKFQRSPFFFAGEFVEGDDRFPFTTDESDDQIFLDEQVRGEAPNRRLGGVVLLERLRPDRLAGFSFQAVV